jgi:hypothetical protein
MASNSLKQMLQIRKRQYLVEQAFDELFSFSQFAEVQIIQRAAAHEADGAISDIFYPDKTTDDDIERFQDERRQLQSQFPQALRVAILGLTHSALETQLVEIARVLAETRGIAVPEKVRTIWPAKGFIEDQLGHAPDSEAWTTMKAYQTVRNAFVHNEGRVDLPLRDGADVSAAAVRIGAETHNSRVVLTRTCAAEFPLLCRRICVEVLRAL